MVAALGMLPLGQALARLAQGYLKEARSRARRLGGASAGEALHDLRVALRRLDSLLRSHGPACDEVNVHKLCRRIRRLARRSNRARDREVQHAWLLQQGKGLKAGERAGYRWLLEQLAPQTDAALQQELVQGVAKLRRKLRQPLKRLEACNDRSFAEATADQVVTLGGELLQQLAAIADATDMPHVHQARIRAKRLRYLLNPLAREVSACATASKSLQRLQDLLGEMHDRQLMQQWLRHVLAQVAAERAGQLFDEAQLTDSTLSASAWRTAQSAGILVIATRNRAALQQCFEQLRQESLDRLQVMDEELHAVVTQLAGAAPD